MLSFGLVVAGTFDGETFTRPAASVPPAKMLNPQDAGTLLQRVVTFYHRALRKDAGGMAYLKKRNLADAGMLEVFQTGYSNGTLHKALPKSGQPVTLTAGTTANLVLEVPGR